MRRIRMAVGLVVLLLPFLRYAKMRGLADAAHEAALKIANMNQIE